MLDEFRLSLCILLFTLSLLTIIRAPFYLAWKLAVGVTEFPHVLFLFAITGFSLRFMTVEYVLAGDILSASSALFFIYPVIAAPAIARKTHEAFGRNGNDAPFSLKRLLIGRGLKKISPKELTYKTSGAIELKLDYYQNKDGKICPTVIVVHGGSWQSGDSKQLPDLNHWLACKGYNVASINYRLAPEFNCPAPVEDLTDAINFLKSRSAEFYLDPNNFILLGRSAGGQISLLTAYSKQIPEIKGVISFYAPADMVWGWSLPGNPLVLDSRKVMRAFVGDTCENAPDKFAASSPIEFVSEKCPPTLLIHGKNECMVAYEHSMRLCRKLKEKNIKHFLISIPWATHGCDYSINGPSGQISTFAIERFLERMFKM